MKQQATEQTTPLTPYDNKLNTNTRSITTIHLLIFEIDFLSERT